MTVSANFGVTGVLCSFGLALEGKASKEIHESSGLDIEMFSANNFALSDPEDSTSESLNKGGIANLPLLRTLLAVLEKSRKPNLWVDKFDIFKNHFPIIIGQPELYFIS